jgi:hypothetical protein
MRSLYICGMMLVLAIPALPALGQSQSAQSGTPAAFAGSSNDPSVEFVMLRDRLATMNKQLNGELANQRALVKHNQELLKQAQKLDASNKKMTVEKQKLSGQNAELQKHRDALRASTPNTETAALQAGGK